MLGAPIAVNHDGKLMAIAEQGGWVRIVNLGTAATVAYPSLEDLLFPHAMLPRGGGSACRGTVQRYLFRRV